MFLLATVLVIGSKPINCPAFTPSLAFLILSFCSTTSNPRALLISLIGFELSKFLGENCISKMFSCVRSVDNEAKLYPILFWKNKKLGD